MNEENSSDDIQRPKHLPPISPTTEFDNVERILNNTGKELLQVQADFVDYFKSNENHLPETRQDEAGSSSDKHVKKSTTQQTKIIKEVKKALSVKTVDKNKAVKEKIEVTDIKTKTNFRGRITNRKLTERDKTAKGSRTRRSSKKTNCKENDDASNDTVPNNIVIPNKCQPETSPEITVTNQDFRSNVKETDSKLVQTENLTTVDNKNPENVNYEHRLYQTVSVSTSPIILEQKSTDITNEQIEIDIEVVETQTPEDITKDITNEVDILPNTISRLSVQKLPSVDIRGSLVTQKIPNLVIHPEESITSSDNIDNIKYLEIKHFDSKFQKKNSSDVLMLETIPEEIVVSSEIFPENIKQEIDEPKENEIIVSKHIDFTNESEEVLVNENTTKENLEEMSKERKTLSEELSIDVNNVPTVKTLQEIQNYLENRIASIKENLLEQRKLISSRHSEISRNIYKPKFELVKQIEIKQHISTTDSSNKNGNEEASGSNKTKVAGGNVRLDVITTSKLTEKYNSIFGDSPRQFRNDNILKLGLPSTSRNAENSDPQPEIAQKNMNLDYEQVITQLHNTNLNKRLSSLRKVLDSYNFPSRKTQVTSNLLQNTEESQSPNLQITQISTDKNVEKLSSPQKQKVGNVNVLSSADESISSPKRIPQALQTENHNLVHKSIQCTLRSENDKMDRKTQTKAVCNKKLNKLENEPAFDDTKTAGTQTINVPFNFSTSEFIRKLAMENASKKQNLAEQATQTIINNQISHSKHENENNVPALKLDFPWHQKLSSTPCTSPKLKVDNTHTSPISTITSGEKTFGKSLSKNKPQGNNIKDKVSYPKDTTDINTHNSSPVTQTEESISSPNKGKGRCRRCKTSRRIRKRCAHAVASKRSKCAIPSSSSYTSEGEYKVNCKCNTSIGESHLCRYANFVRSKVRFYKRNPEELFRKALLDENIKITKEYRHYDNWITYNITRSPKTTYARDVLNS